MTLNIFGIQKFFIDIVESNKPASTDESEKDRRVKTRVKKEIGRLRRKKQGDDQKITKTQIEQRFLPIL